MSTVNSDTTTTVPSYDQIYTPNTAARVAPQKVLGQQDFLHLLTVQMQNQDPTNPVDNTKMISDMANFSSLQAMQDLNKTVGSISQMLNMTQAVQASTLVGHDVVVPGTKVPLATGVAPVAMVNLDQSLTNVHAQLRDSTGNLVREYTWDTLPAGQGDLKWDGKDSKGNVLAPGTYTLSAFGTDSAGARATVGTLVANKVTSVDLASTGATLNLADGSQTSLSNVQQIR
jgi:flagellar basal-body rod modification protein FlgD